MVVQCQKLNKYFKKKFKKIPALQNLHLDIRGGGIIGILGPRGSGKTVLLKILAGVTGWSSGQVKVLGADDPRSVRHKLGYLPQEPAFFPQLTVKRFLRSSLALSSGHTKPQPEALERSLATFGLDGVRDRRIGTLSPSEIRLLGLAQAAAHLPELLLLDAPFSHLEADARGQVIRALAQFQKEGKTVMLTTRRIEDIEDLCSEVVILKQGEVRFHEKVALLQKQSMVSVELEAAGKRLHYRPESLKKLWDILDEARIKDMRIVSIRSGISHILENYYEKSN